MTSGSRLRRETSAVQTAFEKVVWLKTTRRKKHRGCSRKAELKWQMSKFGWWHPLSMSDNLFFLPRLKLHNINKQHRLNKIYKNGSRMFYFWHLPLSWSVDSATGVFHEIIWKIISCQIRCTWMMKLLIWAKLTQTFNIIFRHETETKM